jgi:hypothetical protein
MRTKPQHLPVMLHTWCMAAGGKALPPAASPKTARSPDIFGVDNSGRRMLQFVNPTKRTATKADRQTGRIPKE